MTPDLTSRIHVGSVAGVHGLAGELKVDLSACEPDEIALGAQVWLSWSKGREASERVRSVRPVTAGRRPGMSRVLLGLEGVHDRDAAQKYRGTWLWLPREALSLQPGEFFASDLAGFRVVRGKDGVELGRVLRVEAGPQLRLTVELLDGRRRELPLVAPLAVVSVADKQVVVEAPDGLLD